MRKSIKTAGLFSLLVLLAWFLVPSFQQEALAQAAVEEEKPLRVIMIGAHPDDSEIKGGGTAALWAQAGAEVLLVSVTNGDAGDLTVGGGALAMRRAAESRRSAEFLGVSWRTLDFHDGELVPGLKEREAVMRVIRNWQADIVISHRPNDYHPDHRYTGQLVQDVAYMVAVPNLCPDTPRLEKNPVFMYFLDRFRKPNPFKPDVAVIVDPVMDKKWRSIDAMESQMYEWLPWIGGYLDEVPEGRAERLEWLKKKRGGWMAPWKDRCKEILIERYGEKKVSEARWVESFELCEYGRQPSREELSRLFPK
ncbi:MAG: PIG-L deacetylase family protein [Gemmatimonadota bacterium]|nr:PIG-L deacetylase family protein [Gemmatimonadota bacterium]